MPSPIALPAAAQENMSERAIDQVADRAPHVAPPPGVNTIYSTAADETLFGTAGPDLFVFDGGTPQGSDTIVGFDITQDSIQLIQPLGSAVGLNKLDSESTTFYYEGGIVIVDVDWESLALSDKVEVISPSGDYFL